jgi:hypothetical protein
MPKLSRSVGRQGHINNLRSRHSGSATDPEEQRIPMAIDVRRWQISAVPGAPPRCSTVQKRFEKCLILKDFFASEKQWRRGRDCHTSHRSPIKSGIYCEPDATVCTSLMSQRRPLLILPRRDIRTVPAQCFDTVSAFPGANPPLRLVASTFDVPVCARKRSPAAINTLLPFYP